MTDQFRNPPGTVEYAMERLERAKAFYCDPRHPFVRARMHHLKLVILRELALLGRPEESAS